MRCVTGKQANTVRSAFLLMLCFALMWPAYAQAQAQALVTTSLSSSRIGIDDTVTLDVIARGTDGELDTSELGAVFDIASTSYVEQTRTINGRTDSQRRWSLQISPRATGVVVVPPVGVGGVFSEPLTLDVESAPTGADRELFVEVELDEPSPWVQQQVQVTLRIFHRIRIEQHEVTPPSADGVSLLPTQDVISRVERDGVEFRVIEKRFLLFPQQSGTVELSPMVLTALVPADPSRVRTFFSPQRRVTRRTDPIVLEVQPRPSNVMANWWLPARSVSLSEEWSENVDAVIQTGDVISRRITIVARGIHRTQLPEMPEPDVEGISLYVDSPEDSMDVENGDLLTQRVLSWAAIPQQAGIVTLPAVRIEWFDTVAGVARVAQLPEREIEVQGPAASPATTLESGPTSVAPTNAQGTEAATTGGRLAEPGGENASDFDSEGVSALTTSIPSAGASVAGDTHHWRALALFAMFGWAITGVALVWRELRRGRRASSPEESAPIREPGAQEALSHLKQAAREADLPAAARAIRVWGRAQGSSAGLNSLPAVAQSLDDARVAKDLYALDAHLYRGAASTDPASIDLQRVHDCLSRGLRPAETRGLPLHHSALPSL